MRILKAYGIVDDPPKVGATITDHRMARAFELFSFDFPNISRETFADVQGLRVVLEVADGRPVVRPRDARRHCGAARGQRRAPHRPLDAEAADIDFRFHATAGVDPRQPGDRRRLPDDAAGDPADHVAPPVAPDLRDLDLPRARDGADALAARDRIAYQHRLRDHLESNFERFDAVPEAAP